MAKKIRILHILLGMSMGGIEVWLTQVLRHLDWDRFQIDIQVHDEGQGCLSAEAEKLGARIIHCPYSLNPFVYASHFNRILKEYGPYDIVHSHLPLGGYHMRLARQAGVQGRVIHCHTDEMRRRTKKRLIRRYLSAISTHWIKRHANLGLLCTRQAARNLLGPAWTSDPRWQAFPCGFDLEPFRTEYDLGSVQAEFGIPSNALVIGHVGRFMEVKNHKFLVEVAAEVNKRRPEMRVLLVGDGRLRPTVTEQVAEKSLSDKVIFAGQRSDVGRLMRAMDVFMFPSIWEGLGLAPIEAQLAGVPCVITDTIPEEVTLAAAMVKRLSLGDSAEAWAEAILDFGKNRPEDPRSELTRIAEKSPLNIEINVELLEEWYTRLAA